MKFFVGISILLATAPFARAQSPDPALMSEIRKIRAIDNHAHPVRALAPGEKDDDVDALPVEVMEPSPEPYRTRAENPEVIRAWSSLFDYRYTDRSPEHVRALPPNRPDPEREVIVSRRDVVTCSHY